MASPVIYLAFANDETRPLPDLRREADDIDAHLHNNVHVVKNVHVKSDEITSAPNIIHNLTNFPNRIVLFHFGGHAGDRQLELIDQEVEGEGIAMLLGQQKNLACAFLNGCNTSEMLNDLRSAGVPVVIATSRTIGDTQARVLATEFYKALSQGKTIGAAFNQASAVARTIAGDDAHEIGLHQNGGDAPPEVDFPWGLYYSDAKNLEWRLEDAVMDIDMVSKGVLPRAVLLICSLVLMVVWLMVHVGYQNTELLLGIGSLLLIGVVGWAVKIFGKTVPGLLRIRQRFHRGLLEKPVVIALSAVVLLLWLFMSSVTVRHAGQGPVDVAVMGLLGEPLDVLSVVGNEDLSRILVPVNPLSYRRVIEIEGYVPDTIAVHPIVGMRCDLTSDFSERPTLLIRIPPEEFELRPFAAIRIHVNDRAPLTVPLDGDFGAVIMGSQVQIGEPIVDQWRESLQDNPLTPTAEWRDYCLSVWKRPSVVEDTYSLTPGDSVQITYLTRGTPRKSRTLKIGNKGMHDVLL